MQRIVKKKVLKEKKNFCESPRGGKKKGRMKEMEKKKKAKEYLHARDRSGKKRTEEWRGGCGRL